MQVSPLIKKPIMGVKTTNVNQSFTINGMRKNRQDVSIPVNFPDSLTTQEERQKFINSLANRNVPGQLNHLTGKLMMSQSIMKMNMMHTEQQNLLQFAHNYASYKPVLETKPGTFKTQPNVVPNKRDLNNISVTGHYLNTNKAKQQTANR